MRNVLSCCELKRKTHKFGAFVESFFTMSLVPTEVKLSQKGGDLIPAEKVNMVLHIIFFSSHSCDKNKIMANWLT